MGRKSKRKSAQGPEIQPREPVPYRVWGEEYLDSATLEQMKNACSLPISVRGAQMPDGHVGYGLPIGGVLATRGAVIPYAVGVDIACRVKLSVMDVPGGRLAGWRDKLTKAMRNETCFGFGGEFRQEDRRDHEVMEDPAWDDLPKELHRLKRRAWSQLGSSGSGNHFVEFGVLRIGKPDLGIPPGEYLAFLSHSGSRGFGANVARFYTQIAMDKVRLPRHMKHLAWLDLASAAGQEYWLAMNLAGRYASANHDLIHRHVLRAAGLTPVFQVENHHNFAWKEEHNGEELIVHRKGATPAGEGVLGYIPGSMTDPGFLVRGLGNKAGLCSAAHGAGRVMSRSEAKRTFTGSQLRKALEQAGVELLAAGIDEAPMVYKSLRKVMAAQSDLVEPIAEFQPKLVLMAEGDRAED